MAMKIAEECIACAACEPECPNEAVRADSVLYVIDPGRCTECVGAYERPRCVEVCPVDCIVSDPDHRETPQALHVKYARLHA
jgi:ferredoxin